MLWSLLMSMSLFSRRHSAVFSGMRHLRFYLLPVTSRDLRLHPPTLQNVLAALGSINGIGALEAVERVKNQDRKFKYQWECHSVMQICDNVSERLRRLIRNQLGFACVGSSPAVVDFFVDWGHKR
jgi:hypothetical protein